MQSIQKVRDYFREHPEDARFSGLETKMQKKKTEAA
jgi:hypothetical protein